MLTKAFFIRLLLTKCPIIPANRIVKPIPNMVNTAILPALAIARENEAMKAESPPTIKVSEISDHLELS